MSATVIDRSIAAELGLDSESAAKFDGITETDHQVLRR